MTDAQGREALIHLNVPPELKARWVRESRAAGMRLTDWIIQRVEAQAMKVFKVPESLAHKYHGAGFALAATVNDHLVDVVYLEDVLPDFDGTHAAMLAAMTYQRVAPTVRMLQSLGLLHAGMLSGWEFCEL